MTTSLPPAERLGIGIDTGGTCTDSVIVDLATGEVLDKAKAMTTPDDLSVGIAGALTGLAPELLPRAEFVALSTTLATNAIVEGRGARVGLLMAVPNPASYQLPANLPCERVAVLAGAHNHRGEAVTPLDSQAAEMIDRLAPEVDAFAISGYFSIYNNAHELALRELVTARTAKPAICTHELSGAIGMVERAVTAVLNARLLPVIDELLGAVQRILADLGLDIPLMVVKGDGSMMTGDTCRFRPVETVLSGPAASVAGACRLSGIDDALVVDMGGTTTDIAVVRNGQAAISREGAMVGGWRTRVQAVDMWTLGAGGDSHIRCVNGTELKIGPQRAIPFSLAGTFFPRMAERLHRLFARDQRGLGNEECTFYTLRKRPPGLLNPALERLVVGLDRQVLTLAEIRADISAYLDIDGLEAQGYLIQVGFTPTDLLHTTGEKVLWDREAAEAGLRLLIARHSTIDNPAAMQMLISKELARLLARAMAAKALQDDVAIAAGWNDSCPQLLDRLLRLDSPAIAATFALKLPLVAVGAPAHAHLPAAAALLSAVPAVVPHAEVANAYGAVIGKVTGSATAVIRPASPDGYLVLCHEFRQRVVQLEEAIRLASARVAGEAEQLALARGAEQLVISEHREEVFAPLQSGWGAPVLLEMRITATAEGSPRRRAREPWPLAATLEGATVRPSSVRVLG